jgi:ParB/RepB/Spo0J family partition protein
MIPIDRLDLNMEQPRVEIGDLSDLVASIREKGILEPLLVRPKGDGRFMIISGERRYRAALIVGLREVPCIEMEVDDRAVAEITLIENLQRKDLTPFEEAQGFKLLVERFGYTHEEIARKIGKSRSSVTETLALAEMPEEYNMALGDRRAHAARDFLISLGIAPERIQTVSFGETRPAVPESNERAWALNRRDEFVYIQGGETTPPRR